MLITITLYYLKKIEFYNMILYCGFTFIIYLKNFSFYNFFYKLLNNFFILLLNFFQLI